MFADTVFKEDAVDTLCLPLVSGRRRHGLDAASLVVADESVSARHSGSSPRFSPRCCNMSSVLRSSSTSSIAQAHCARYLCEVLGLECCVIQCHVDLQTIGDLIDATPQED
jgi:hypothetical protein